MVWFPHLVFILHKPCQGVIWVEITLSRSDVLKILDLVDVAHVACLMISALFSMKMLTFSHYFLENSCVKQRLNIWHFDSSFSISVVISMENDLTRRYERCDSPLSLSSRSLNTICVAACHYKYFLSLIC